MKKIVICSLAIGCALFLSSSKVHAHSHGWSKPSHSHHKPHYDPIYRKGQVYQHKYVNIPRRYRYARCGNYSYGVKLGPHVTVTANHPYHSRHNQCGRGSRPRVNVKVYPGHGSYHH